MEVSNNFFLVLVLLIVSLPFIYAQVAGGQIVDLSERARDPFVEATKGNIVGQETGNQFGENLALGATEVDIQTQGGVLVFLESAEFMDIVSADTVNDILGGANANTVLVKGLDENFDEISETVNLSAAGSTTVNQYMRIQLVEVMDVGTYGFTNVGIISITSNTTLNLQVEIPVAEGRSSSTHYTVPAGQNLIITAFGATMNAGRSVDLLLNFRPRADETLSSIGGKVVARTFRGLSTPVGRRSFGNLKFDEKTDIWFSGSTIGGGPAAQVEINYDFMQYAIGS